MTTMLRLVQIVDVVVVAVMMMITLPSTGQSIAKLSLLLLLLMMTMSSTGDQLKSDRCPFTGNPDRCIYELDHWYRLRWWWSWWSSSVCSPYWWLVNSYIVGVGRKSNCFGFFWFPSRIQSSPSNGNTFHQSSCHCSCHCLVANLSMDFCKTPVSQLLLHKALWLPQRVFFLSE